MACVDGARRLAVKRSGAMPLPPTVAAASPIDSAVGFSACMPEKLTALRFENVHTPVTPPLPVDALRDGALTPERFIVSALPGAGPDEDPPPTIFSAVVPLDATLNATPPLAPLTTRF